jgi:hypothetical protein
LELCQLLARILATMTSAQRATHAVVTPPHMESQMGRLLARQSVL